MPELVCTFCGHEWVQPALSLWSCPSCEMGVARELVREATNEEIDELWSYLSAAAFKPTQLTPLHGHSGYFAGYRLDDLRMAIDLLVLLFDVIVIPELWKCIEEDDPLCSRFIEYYDHDAVVPLDQGDVLHLLHNPQTSLHAHVARRGAYLSILEGTDTTTLKGPGFFFARENLMKILASLDFKRDGWYRDSLYQRLRSQDLIEEMATGGPDHLVNHVNGALITSQYLALPVTMAGVLEEILRWKLGVDSNWTPNTEYGVLQRFASSLRIPVPIRSKDVLSLRESPSGQELRRQLQVSCSRAQDATEAIAALHDEYTRALSDLEDRARSFGDVSVSVVSGMFSTLGGVLGGAVGAVIGGIGGTVVSLGTKTVFKRIYETTHKNWAYYFRRWGKAGSGNHAG